MSAQHIPNLKTLLGDRGNRGGFGRRKRGVSSHGGHDDTHSAADSIIQRTDDDASGSRMSAVELGYLQDTYAQAFFDGPAVRRLPIMNRGTYVRTTAIDRLVEQFLDTYDDRPKQIISLGAGSDTRYFRIISRRAMTNLVYREFDFPSITAKKIAALRQSPHHLQTLQTARGDFDEDPKISADGTSFLSPTYCIHAIDLRSLAESITPGEDLPVKPALPYMSPTTPTLLLSECCLIYLPPSAAEALLANIAKTFIPAPTPLSLVMYEPIRPNDAFGRVMVSNLAARGIRLQTLQKFSSLSRQRERLRLTGFTGGQCAADVEFLWNQWVAQGEKDRVANLEMLDELEEWQLLAQHYCVAWGWRSGEAEGGDVFDVAWGDLEAQDAPQDDDVG